MRALQTARALKKLGRVSCAVISSDSGTPEGAKNTAEEFEFAGHFVPELSPNRRLDQKVRWALDTRYLNVHGSRVSDNDRRTLLRLLPQFDLIWVLNSRVPSALQVWDWPRTHLDIDDIPSTYHASRAQSEKSTAARWKALALKTLFKRRERLLPYRFTTLSVCSDADRAYLQGGSRVHVIPNGFTCPTAPPTRNLSSKHPRVGFIGLCSYEPNRRGIEWFLKNCWSQIQAQVPEARFRIIGRDSELFQPMRGVEPLGWVDDPADEMASWSVMINPIHLGAGTRIKIADAFSRKCPVVSTRWGAYGYEVADGRELLLADTPEDFAQACVRMIRDPQSANEIAENAWSKFLDHWTWDAISPRIIAAAEDCLRLSENSATVRP